jgi:hypothetical protein
MRKNKMNTLIRFSLGLFIVALSLPAFALTPAACRLKGTYASLYKGTMSIPSPYIHNPNLAPSTAVLTGNGVFKVEPNGHLTGEGTYVLNFADFFGYPLWLVVHEVDSGDVAPNTLSPCNGTGTIKYAATATVIKTSDEGLVKTGTVLLKDDPRNPPRSTVYVISGLLNDNVEMISTVQGVTTSGTAHKTTF